MHSQAGKLSLSVSVGSALGATHVQLHLFICIASLTEEPLEVHVAFHFQSWLFGIRPMRSPCTAHVFSDDELFGKQGRERVVVLFF